MMHFNETTKDALVLSSRIINREYKNDNWFSLLDDLSKLFDVDGAFIGFWRSGLIEFKYSSFLIGSTYDRNKYPDLYSVSLNDRKYFKDALEKYGYIKITDYENFPYSLDAWKGVGLKSLLAATIRTKEKIYGSLHLVSIDKKIDFSEENIQVLKIISRAIASELEKEAFMRKIEKEKEINAEHIEFINSMAITNYAQSNLNEFIRNTIKKLNAMIKTDVVGFIFPAEDIYVMSNESLYKKNIDLEKNMFYDMYKKNITHIIRKDRCNVLLPEKSVIFIPIVSNDKTIAAFCVCFAEKDKDIPESQIKFIQAILRYFTFLIYTQRNLSKTLNELSATEAGLIKSFVSSLEAKDVYTKGHAEHVAIYSKKIAEVIGLNSSEQNMMYNAGLLHDIGKIGIPDSILSKPGKLTEHEYNIVKFHPVFSYEIVKSIPKFKNIANCIRHHHEKLDGSGYPDGLKDEQIELGARILAIADIFDALTTKRPYRKNMTAHEAISILKNEAVDQKILSKVEGMLKESFINEVDFKATFVPVELENIRKEISLKDNETGFYKRSALVKKMGSHIGKDERFTLFMVDIKNLSYINYKYGVDVGNKVITFVSDELKKIPQIDALSRTDTDVFMFIYRGSEILSFKEILFTKLKNGIIRRAKEKSCVVKENEIGKAIGCYITYSIYPDESKNAEDLIYRCIVKKNQSRENLSKPKFVEI